MKDNIATLKEVFLDFRQELLDQRYNLGSGFIVDYEDVLTAFKRVEEKTAKMEREVREKIAILGMKRHLPTQRIKDLEEILG